MPVSDRTTSPLDSDMLSRMKKTELRRLVNRMPGIVGDKINAKGMWLPNTCVELRADLLALKAAKSAQALLGRTTNRERPRVIFPKLLGRDSCQSLAAQMSISDGIDMPSSLGHDRGGLLLP